MKKTKLLMFAILVAVMGLLMAFFTSCELLDKGCACEVCQCNCEAVDCEYADNDYDCGCDCVPQCCPPEDSED